MLTRRQLLRRGTTLLLLVPFVHACSGDDAMEGPPVDAPMAPTCAVEPTSTVVNAHSHTVCVLTSDLTNPPSEGATYTTSLVTGHTHTVTLTQAQLVSIEAGTPVDVQTSLEAQHVHGFTISRLT